MPGNTGGSPVLQEREKRDEEWAPRFFTRTPGKEVFSTEYSDAECPLWEFNGKYLHLERETPAAAGESAFCHGSLSGWLVCCTGVVLTAAHGEG